MKVLQKDGKECGEQHNKIWRISQNHSPPPKFRNFSGGKQTKASTKRKQGGKAKITEKKPSKKCEHFRAIFQCLIWERALLGSGQSEIFLFASWNSTCITWEKWPSTTEPGLLAQDKCVQFLVRVRVRVSPQTQSVILPSHFSRSPALLGEGPQSKP